MSADTVQPPSASVATTVGRHRHSPAIVIGAVIGLTWSAALRGWAVQLAGEESSLTWQGLGSVMLPGAFAGALLGYAADARGREGAPQRMVVWAALLLLAAMLGSALPALPTGTPGVVVVMVATGLCIGDVLTHWRFSLRTVLGGTVAASGTVAITILTTMTVPITTARGTWVCLFAISLVLVLGLASTLPHKAPQLPGPGATGYVGIGLLCGLAWACALRSFMAAIAGPESQVAWLNTVVWILLMGAIAGALLGRAEYRRSMGSPRPALTAAPLLFAGVLLPGLMNPTSMFEAGIGGGALGVPLLGMAGAYGLAGTRTWARAVCGSLFLAGMVLWVMVAPAVGGGTFALNTARGLWATILFLGLLITLALAATIPLRAVPERCAPV